MLSWRFAEGSCAVDTLFPTALFRSPVVAAIVGWIMGVSTGLILNWFNRPKLSLYFKPDDGKCIAQSAQPKVRWARVSVMNCGRTHLSRCQAFVSDLKREQNGRWVKTEPPFIDPLVLEWAATTEATKYEPRDLPRKIEFFINILASADSGSGHDNLALTVQGGLPLRLKSVFKPGRYCITVTVTGDQAKPKHRKVIVNWMEKWEFETSAC
jgi:hypothetical protein